MARTRSASNILEFLIASLVMGGLIAMLIPVTCRVYETSENIRYAKMLKVMDAGNEQSKAKTGNIK
jgi:hypothetical protein